MDNHHRMIQTSNGGNANQATPFQEKKKKKRYSKQQKRDHKEKQTQQQQHQQQPYQQQQQQQQQQQNPHDQYDYKPRLPQPPPPTRYQPPTNWLDQIQECVQNATHTGAILLNNRHEPISGGESTLLSTSRMSQIRLLTSSSLPIYNNWTHISHEMSNHESLTITTTKTTNGHDEQQKHHQNPNQPLSDFTIQVKPLILLDLNGILCYRHRKRKEVPGAQLRPPIGKVAGTPVIPRMDLGPFLRFLEQHFCLAVWTSAQPHTAHSLVSLLFPRDVQERLLCIWTQEECVAIPPTPTPSSSSSFSNHNNHNPKQRHKKGYQEVIYEKRLANFWRAYPLWNANNTLLIDDSPEKCPFAPSNALHPPPINGQKQPPTPSQQQQYQNDHPSSSPQWLSDEVNDQIQQHFFRLYAEFWKQNVYLEYLNENTVPSPQLAIMDTIPSEFRKVPVKEEMENQPLHYFLRQYGTGHMGWRIPVLK